MSREGYDSFSREVARDGELAARLREPQARDAFVPVAVAEAGRRGFDVDGGDVRAAITRAEIAWQLRAVPGTVPTDGEASEEVGSWKGWVPVGVGSSDAGPLVEFRYVGARAFQEPFFGQTIEAAVRHPYSLLFPRRIGFPSLRELALGLKGPALRGVVFHMSRCGSTLVTRMLSVLPGTMVLSEPAAFDDVLRVPGPVEAVASRLRDVVTALGASGSGLETDLFIKVDAWTALDLAVVRRAFPEVPWVFVFREGVEVLVSQIRLRAHFLMPGALDPARFGLTLPQALLMPVEEYLARVLGRVCEAAAETLEAGTGRAIDYESLVERGPEVVASAFGLSPGIDGLRAMRDVARRDAKDPEREYRDDRAAKRGSASAEARLASDVWVRPALDRVRAAARSRDGSWT